MDGCAERTRELLLAGQETLELSFVELVVAATECSEDASEIGDLLDGLLVSERIRLEDGPAPSHRFEARSGDA